ncbi:flagellar biosynthesis anti-sigma factor FlgM [Craterilacuibacter sp.]|uniref:flagellar biosynthesis anti-sigma factor FlgM n=1 Tax=Craterilacuibacter sp. TaxID=2870909 RepID=UPI003F37B93F
MRITPQRTELRELATSTRSTPPASSPARAAASVGEAGRIAPTMQALSAMPDVDMDKVLALREALARGEIGFDADKLAGLIARYHGAAR